MEATGYNWVPDGAHACAALVKKIYAGHPAYAEALAAETLRQLAPQNPFLAFGSRQGFLAAGAGGPEAHACAIIDKRLPGVGLIGYFEAAGGEAAAAVLDAACAHLAELGLKKIFGPVNDTVWQRYGAASGNAEPFYGEPYTPAAYAGYFGAAGFTARDRRVSAVLPAEELPFAAFSGREQDLLGKGYTFEELAPAELPARAREIHALAGEVFSGSPLFVPASYEEFLYSAGAQAGAAGAHFILAGCGGRPAAFLWGLPDACSGGENFIFKTIAVLPQHRRSGLGGALFCRMQARVRERGFKRCFFSTMRAGNAGIAALTVKKAGQHREYLTFGKEAA